MKEGCHHEGGLNLKFKFKDQIWSDESYGVKKKETTELHSRPGTYVIKKVLINFSVKEHCLMKKIKDFLKNYNKEISNF